MIRFGVVLCISVALVAPCRGEEVLFEDNFDDGLSEHWKPVGIAEGDFRIRDGGLELRVAPGKVSGQSPRIEIEVPILTADVAIASVEITPLTEFSAPGELAGLYLTDEDGPEFGAKRQLVDRRFVFAPGLYEFIGNSGEEGDPNRYSVTYFPVNYDSGASRIVVRGNYAYHQVGPDRDGKYLNLFHSAIRRDAKRRGFCLMAVGGPEDEEHWVRFDNFRVTR